MAYGLTHGDLWSGLGVESGVESVVEWKTTYREVIFEAMSGVNSSESTRSNHGATVVRLHEDGVIFHWRGKKINKFGQLIDASFRPIFNLIQG